jgi:hypothetical protein
MMLIGSQVKVFEPTVASSDEAHMMRSSVPYLQQQEYLLLIDSSGKVERHCKAVKLLTDKN